MTSESFQPRSVVIIAMYYAPETTGSAPYITDTANCYASAGHQVHVFTTWPHYPAWRADRSQGVRDMESPPGVTVHRIRTYVPKNPTLFRRTLYEALFSLVALTKVLRTRHIDIVCGCSPNLFSAAVAAIAGKLRRRPVLQFVQDIVSSALVQTSQSDSGLALRLLSSLEGWSLKSAVLIVAPTDAFREPLALLGVDKDRIRTIRNWSRVAVKEEVSAVHVDGLVLHTGNIGQKQSLDLLSPALSIVTALDPRLEFHFVGNGNRRRELVESVSDIPRVSVKEPVSSEDYPELLRRATVLLVHERPGVLDMSLPSKLTSYFASGRPVVAIVDLDSLTAREIRASGAGIVVGHNDPATLASVLTGLLDDPAQGAALGAAGHAYRKRFLTQEAAFDRLEATLTEAMHRAQSS